MFHPLLAALSAVAILFTSIATPAVQGDLMITLNGKPIVTGSQLSATQMQNVAAAKTSAAQSDPGSASTLADPNISVGVLPDSAAKGGLKAVTDGNTMLVTKEALEGDVVALSVILAHEADHAENGPLPDCQHAGAFMDVAGHWAAIINGPGGHAGMCDKFKDATATANKLLASCNASGGTPTKADGSPIPDWPMPNPPCD